MPAVHIPNPDNLMNESLAWDVAHAEKPYRDFYAARRETLSQDEVLDVGMQLGEAAIRAEISWHDVQAAAAQYDTGPAVFAPAEEVPDEPVELPEPGSTTVLSAAQTALAAETEAARPPAEKVRPKVRLLESDKEDGEEQSEVEKYADKFVSRWAVSVKYPDAKGNLVTLQNDRDKALGDRIEEYGLSVPPLDALDGYLTEDTAEFVTFDAIPGQTYTPFTGHRLKGSPAADEVVLMRYATPVQALEGQTGGTVIMSAVLPRTTAELIQAHIAEDRNPELPSAILGGFLLAHLPDRAMAKTTIRLMPNHREWNGKVWVEGRHQMRIRSDLYPVPNQRTGQMGPEDIIVNIPPLPVEAPADPEEEKKDKGGGVGGRIGRALIRGIGDSRE